VAPGDMKVVTKSTILDAVSMALLVDEA